MSGPVNIDGVRKMLAAARALPKPVSVIYATLGGLELFLAGEPLVTAEPIPGPTDAPLIVLRTATDCLDHAAEDVAAGYRPLVLTEAGAFDPVGAAAAWRDREQSRPRARVSPACGET